jgi:DNA/RNA endonuclease YhcR with UshA esterase domain
MLALRNQVLTMTLVLALLATSFAAPPSAASTSPAAALANGSVDIFPAYVANDGVVSGGSLTAGTPFMAHVAFTGLDPNTQYYGPKGYVPGSGFNWNNNTWKLGTAAWTGYTTFTTSASGIWSGWFAVCADATNTPTTGNFRAGCRKTDATTNLYTDYISITTMSMVATGGWVEGHAYGVGMMALASYSVPLAGRRVVVKDSGGTIVGLYATEDNGVAEGYNSSDTGYYKIAAPAGSDYTAEVWDANNARIGSPSTPFSVTIGATKSGVDINAAPPEADLAITKAAPGLVLAGATLPYTLAFTHTNAFPGSVLTITDTIPGNVNWVASNPPPTASSGRDYVWMKIITTTTPGLYTGTIAITTTVGGGVAAGTVLTNTAGITTTIVDTNPANNFARTTTKVSPTPVPIATARGYANGTLAAIVGTTTARYTGSEMVVQDDTGGITIYYYGGLPAASEGSVIQAMGIVTDYYGLRELIPASAGDAMVLGTAPVPAPRPSTTGGVGESTEGWLIVVTGTVTSTVGTDIYINDGSGTLDVFIKSGTNIDISGITPGDILRITGVGYQYNRYQSPGYEIIPRKQADIVNLGNPTPPEVTFLYPPADGRGVPPSAWVSATFNKRMTPGSFTPTTFSLADATGSAITGTVSYITGSLLAMFQPGLPLMSNAAYTATLAAGIADAYGYTMTQSVIWSFTTGEGAPVLPDGMHAYFGDLHSHTGYSDGKGTPAEAYTSGRARGLDFLSVTDHSNWLDPAGVEWADELVQANSATVDGTFVGLRGFEWTHSTVGHINVYASDTYVDAKVAPYNDLNTFYSWLVVTATTGSVAQFNHPWEEYGDFNNFAYHAAADGVIQLQELSEGNQDVPGSYHSFEAAYRQSLAAGWHVGATDNSDAHNADWGSKTPHRTGIVAPNLTPADVLDAMRAQRTFATEDSNLALVMQANGVWMGAVISNALSIQLDVLALDPDAEPIIFTLYDNGVPVLTSPPYSGAAAYSWQPIIQPIGPGGHYYYVKALQGDGDQAWTSPVWTDTSRTIYGIYLPLVFKAYGGGW